MSAARRCDRCGAMAHGNETIGWVAVDGYHITTAIVAGQEECEPGGGGDLCTACAVAFLASLEFKEGQQ